MEENVKRLTAEKQRLKKENQSFTQETNDLAKQVKSLLHAQQPVCVPCSVHQHHSIAMLYCIYIVTIAMLYYHHCTIYIIKSANLRITRLICDFSKQRKTKFLFCLFLLIFLF